MASSDQIVDFLSLFIPAMIGVGGSLYLYHRRQSDRQSRLRDALYAELKGMEYLQKWPDVGTTVPAYDFTSTYIFEKNADNMGLLSKKEVESVVDFYTRVNSVRDLLGLHQDFLIGESDLTKSNASSRKRKRIVRRAIDKLEISRLRALLSLEENILDEEVKWPRKGIPVTQIFDNHVDVAAMLADYGLAEEQDGTWVFTERGEQFFEGEIIQTGLSKDKDLLDRKVTSRKKIYWFFKGLFQTLKNWIPTSN